MLDSIPATLSFILKPTRDGSRVRMSIRCWFRGLRDSDVGFKVSQNEWAGNEGGGVKWGGPKVKSQFVCHQMVPFLRWKERKK